MDFTSMMKTVAAQKRGHLLQKKLDETLAQGKHPMQISLTIGSGGLSMYEVISESDPSKKYQIGYSIVDGKPVQMCSCGMQFGVGPRNNCKHILAVIKLQMEQFIAAHIKDSPEDAMTKMFDKMSC